MYPPLSTRVVTVIFKTVVVSTSQQHSRKVESVHDVPSHLVVDHAIQATRNFSESDSDSDKKFTATATKITVTENRAILYRS
jgi:hypothetical protein